MADLRYRFDSGGEAHSLDMIFVAGTRGRAYLFGDTSASLAVEIEEFFIARFPVTQALWTHVMCDNPAVVRGDRRPVENVSWTEVTRAGGFLDRINASPILAQLSRQHSNATNARFRLPSETEWEYA